jgi:hypothetical protein|eukprot:COSAG01_NODE_4617_length_4876_cov_14.078082_5_plen_115_part_00
METPAQVPARFRVVVRVRDVLPRDPGNPWALLQARAVASFLVAVLLTEMYLRNVCSCQEILRRNGGRQPFCHFCQRCSLDTSQCAVPAPPAVGDGRPPPESSRPCTRSRCPCGY